MQLRGQEVAFHCTGSMSQIVNMLHFATGSVWCFVAGELEEEGENNCNAGEDVSERCEDDEARLHGPGWTDDEGNFIIFIMETGCSGGHVDKDKEFRPV